MTLSLLPWNHPNSWCGAAGGTSKHFFYRQTAMPSAYYGGVGEIKESSPVGYSHPSAIEFKPDIPSGVVCLFSSVGPFAVFFTIITIVIYSFERLANFVVPHISQEILKIEPAITNLYSSAAIVFKGLIVWIKTPVLHCRPNPLNSGVAHFVGGVSGNKNFPMDAPA